MVTATIQIKMWWDKLSHVTCNCNLIPTSAAVRGWFGACLPARVCVCVFVALTDLCSTESNRIKWTEEQETKKKKKHNIGATISVVSHRPVMAGDIGFAISRPLHHMMRPMIDRCLSDFSFHQFCHFIRRVSLFASANAQCGCRWNDRI